MDVRETTAPKSDQISYDDVMGQSVNVTIVDVRQGNAEQPVWIDLAEYPGRPWKPSKGMRRLLVAAWGPDSEAYIGRRVTLYGDPTVKWGGQEVGGIRVKALSHLAEPLTVKMAVSRAKRQPYTVQPLTGPTVQDVNACDNLETLRDMWDEADFTTQRAITARAQQIKAGQQ